jgi:hypothetical protein
VLLVVKPYNGWYESMAGISKLKRKRLEALQAANAAKLKQQRPDQQETTVPSAAPASLPVDSPVVEAPQTPAVEPTAQCTQFNPLSLCSLCKSSPITFIIPYFSSQAPHQLAGNQTHWKAPVCNKCYDLHRQRLIDVHDAATATVEQAREKGRDLAKEKALQAENELKLAIAKVATTLEREIQALEDELIKRTQQVEELESDLENYDLVRNNLEELERRSQAIETHNREQQARVETLQQKLDEHQTQFSITLTTHKEEKERMRAAADRHKKVAALLEGVSLKYLRKLKADNFGRNKSRYNSAQDDTVPLPAVATNSSAPSTKLPGTTNTFKAGLILRRQEWQHQHKVSYARRHDRELDELHRQWERGEASVGHVSCFERD